MKRDKLQNCFRIVSVIFLPETDLKEYLKAKQEAVQFYFHPLQAKAFVGLLFWSLGFIKLCKECVPLIYLLSPLSLLAFSESLSLPP